MVRAQSTNQMYWVARCTLRGVLLLNSFLLGSRADASSTLLHFTTVFRNNDTINSCYRIPLITTTANGTLLAVAEERYGAGSNGTAGCDDNYHKGKVGGHNQVSRRSTDNGATWGPLLRQVGSLKNLHAVDGIDYTNPSIVNINLPSGQTKIIYHYSTQNNPSIAHHGRTMQLVSTDDGITFLHSNVNVSEQLSAPGSPARAYPGATPGPLVGFQTGSRAIFCAWGSTGVTLNYSFPSTCQPDCGDFLYSSTDSGLTWSASPPINGAHANECTIAPLKNGSVVMISRLANWQRSPHHYAISIWSPDLKFRGPLRNLTGIPTPICEGALLAHPKSNALYFSNPSNDAKRINLTIHKSTDAGLTWPVKRVIWPGLSGTVGYSSMAATAAGIAIIFEGGDQPFRPQNVDRWIKVTHLPWF